MKEILITLAVLAISLAIYFFAPKFGIPKPIYPEGLNGCRDFVEQNLTEQNKKIVEILKLESYLSKYKVIECATQIDRPILVNGNKTVEVLQLVESQKPDLAIVTLKASEGLYQFVYSMDFGKFVGLKQVLDVHPSVQKLNDFVYQLSYAKE